MELHRKLAKRGFASEAIARLLDELTSEGLLCEARLAELYVAERLRKGFGPLRVREELRRKGLADDLIDPHLDLEGDQWLERIAAAHAKRFGPDRPVEAKELARRGRFLEGRGFPAALVARFLLEHRGDGPRPAATHSSSLPQ